MSSQDTSPIPYDQRDGVMIYHESTSVVAVIEGITIVVIFLGALVANLIAMVTILRDKVLRRNLHNWLILNLIINDLGFTIMNISLLVVSVFDQGYSPLHNKAVCFVSLLLFCIFHHHSHIRFYCISIWDIEETSYFSSKEICQLFW